MIQIVLVRTKTGEFVSVDAEGHSFFSKKGSDIVCAAVTCLLRTTLSVLETNKNIETKAKALKRGTLSFCVIKKEQSSDKEQEKELSSLLMYARDFLENGLTSLCSEYPQHVSLKITIN